MAPVRAILSDLSLAGRLAVRKDGREQSCCLGGGCLGDRSVRTVERIRVNDRIRERELRVVDDEGGQLGVMQTFEAIRLAREGELDMVERSPSAAPPVCKITDYGKY